MNINYEECNKISCIEEISFGVIIIRLIFHVCERNLDTHPPASSMLWSIRKKLAGFKPLSSKSLIN
jgi:hypothetical protein